MMCELEANVGASHRPAIAYENRHMAQEKIQGVSVSDEMIESWAAEAEAGYPLEQPSQARSQIAWRWCE
jgi:hypothetical protein